MATSAAEIDFIPDEASAIDFVPDEPAAAPAIDFIPDEDVANAAQNSATVAQQALGVLTLPGQFDWSAANEELDKQRFTEAESLKAQAMLAEEHGSGTGPGSEAFNLKRQRDFQLGQITPNSSVGRRLAQQGRSELQSINEVGNTAARPETPASVLSSFLGPGLTANVQPTIEAAGRNFGSAAGGAAGAALGAAATAGTFGIAPFVIGLGSALLGSYAGGQAEEKVLELTETPEETQARQQRAAEDAQAHPASQLMGGMGATAPFFGPSLAQFGRAAAGDIGAIRNIAAVGGIGAGMEVASAALRGETAKAKDIAEAFFMNSVMNEPTKLGRAIGLHPSSEQAMTEEAQQKYRELPPLEPIGRSAEADLTTRGTSSTADVFAGVPRKKAPQIDFVPDNSLFSEFSSLPPSSQASPKEGVPESLHFQLGDYWAEPVEVPLSKLEDIETAAISDHSRSRVREARETNKELPPIDVAVWQNGDTQILDGNHRLTEARERGDKSIKVRFTFPDKPTTTEPNAQQISETSPPDGGVRTPEVPRQDEPLPAAEGGEGVQPSGQGKSLAEAAPEAPREVGTAEPPPVTSIKNAVTEQERAARGISPAEEPARRAFGEVWDAAKAEATENPGNVDGLIASLEKKARPISDREDALLLHRQIELQKAFDTTAAEVNRAAEAGDEPVRQEAQARLDGIREALQKVYDVGKQAGTETARGLNARKMIADQDFNLASMETRLRADNGGKLSEEQLAKVKQQAETIQKTQEGMDKILAERAAAEQAEGSLDPKIKSLADRIIARLDIAAANAAKSLRSKLQQQLGSGLDVSIVADVAKIAAAKTAKGAIKFAQWSAEMIRDFGEKVRPYLQAGWEQREQHIDAEVGAATAKAKRRTRTDAEKEQSAVKARLTALANRTAELQKRTAAGDFSPRRKPPADLSKNPEWVRLKAENDSAKAAYEKARYEARKAQRTTEQKIRDTVADVWAASRPLLASTDFSAPGRQGIFFALPDILLNPKRLGRQLATMFRSQFSETQYQRNEASIKSRENAPLYEESGLYLADIDHKPSAREEQFKSELAEKLPGVGRIVRGSSRGFSAFMNTARADAFDAFVRWAGGKDKIASETAKFLAEAVNDLSGRGNVTSRQAAGAMEWLAKYLFSPRLWVSRFHTALLKPVWRDPLNRNISPRARAVVLGQYVRFAATVAAIRALGSFWGMTMDLDPRSSSFGKLRVGTKTYDILGGIGNMVTLLARVVSGTTKDDKGKTLRIAWKDEKRPERELGQIIFNHLRNKMAPVPGAVYDFFYGRHPDRSKVTPGSMVKQTVMPITVSDTIGFFQKDNPASALKDTLLNAFGITVQDYRK